MKRLPILTATVVLAAWLASQLTDPSLIPAMVKDPANAEPSPASPESESEAVDPEGGEDVVKQAQQVLRNARNRLFERLSVKATLQETVAIGDAKFQASGTYVAGEFPDLRMEYEVAVGETTGTLLEVCDGQLLWTVQEIEGGNDRPRVQISRTVIDDVLREVQDSGHDPEPMLIAGMGMGGLPALLAALERSMTFDALKVVEHEGQSYTVIQGQWNDDYLARFGGSEENALPKFVPDRVRIYFHQETLFPTRILYLKRISEDSKLAYRSLLSLEFSDIELDGVVDEEQFRYVPEDGIPVENRTSEFLELIKAAKERAAAAGDEAP